MGHFVNTWRCCIPHLMISPSIDSRTLWRFWVDTNNDSSDLNFKLPAHYYFPNLFQTYWSKWISHESMSTIAKLCFNCIPLFNLRGALTCCSKKFQKVGIVFLKSFQHYIFLFFNCSFNKLQVTWKVSLKLSSLELLYKAITMLIFLIVIYHNSKLWRNKWDMDRSAFKSKLCRFIIVNVPPLLSFIQHKHVCVCGGGRS